MIPIDLKRCRAVCTGNLNPYVMMMKPAENSLWRDLSDSLNGTMSG